MSQCPTFPKKIKKFRKISKSTNNVPCFWASYFENAQNDLDVLHMETVSSRKSIKESRHFYLVIGESPLGAFISCAEVLYEYVSFDWRQPRDLKIYAWVPISTRSLVAGGFQTPFWCSMNSIKLLLYKLLELQAVRFNMKIFKSAALDYYEVFLYVYTMCKHQKEKLSHLLKRE